MQVTQPSCDGLPHRLSTLSSPLLLRAEDGSDILVDPPATINLDVILRRAGQETEAHTLDVHTGQSGPKLTLAQYQHYMQQRATRISIDDGKAGRDSSSADDEVDSSVAASGRSAVTQQQLARSLVIDCLAVDGSSLASELSISPAMLDASIAKETVLCEVCSNAEAQQLHICIGPRSKQQPYQLSPCGSFRWLHVLSGKVVVRLLPGSDTNLEAFVRHYHNRRVGPLLQLTAHDQPVTITCDEGSSLVVPSGWLTSLEYQQSTVIVGGVYWTLNALESHVRCLEVENKLRDVLPMFGPRMFLQALWCLALRCTKSLQAQAALPVFVQQPGARNKLAMRTSPARKQHRTYGGQAVLTAGRTANDTHEFQSNLRQHDGRNGSAAGKKMKAAGAPKGSRASWKKRLKDEFLMVDSHESGSSASRSGASLPASSASSPDDSASFEIIGADTPVHGKLRRNQRSTAPKQGSGSAVLAARGSPTLPQSRQESRKRPRVPEQAESDFEPPSSDDLIEELDDEPDVDLSLIQHSKRRRMPKQLAVEFEDPDAALRRPAVAPKQPQISLPAAPAPRAATSIARVLKHRNGDAESDDFDDDFGKRDEDAPAPDAPALQVPRQDRRSADASDEEQPDWGSADDSEPASDGGDAVSAQPSRRSRRAAAGGRLREVLAAEHASDGGTDVSGDSPSAARRTVPAPLAPRRIKLRRPRAAAPALAQPDAAPAPDRPKLKLRIKRLLPTIPQFDGMSGAMHADHMHDCCEKHRVPSCTGSVYGAHHDSLAQMRQGDGSVMDDAAANAAAGAAARRAALEIFAQASYAAAERFSEGGGAEMEWGPASTQGAAPGGAAQRNMRTDFPRPVPGDASASGAVRGAACYEHYRRSCSFELGGSGRARSPDWSADAGTAPRHSRIRAWRISDAVAATPSPDASRLANMRVKRRAAGLWPINGDVPSDTRELPGAERYAVPLPARRASSGARKPSGGGNSLDSNPFLSGSLQRWPGARTPRSGPRSSSCLGSDPPAQQPSCEDVLAQMWDRCVASTSGAEGGPAAAGGGGAPSPCPQYSATQSAVHAIPEPAAAGMPFERLWPGTALPVLQCGTPYPAVMPLASMYLPHGMMEPMSVKLPGLLGSTRARPSDPSDMHFLPSIPQPVHASTSPRALLAALHAGSACLPLAPHLDGAFRMPAPRPPQDKLLATGPSQQKLQEPASKHCKSYALSQQASEHISRTLCRRTPRFGRGNARGGSASTLDPYRREATNLLQTDGAGDIDTNTACNMASYDADTVKAAPLKVPAAAAALVSMAERSTLPLILQLLKAEIADAPLSLRDIPVAVQDPEGLLASLEAAMAANQIPVEADEHRLPVSLRTGARSKPSLASVEQGDSDAASVGSPPQASMPPLTSQTEIVRRSNPHVTPSTVSKKGLAANPRGAVSKRSKVKKPSLRSLVDGRR